eukprot:s275_g32.t2
MARDYGIAAAFDAGHHWAPHAGPGGGNHQSQPGELENAETSGVRPCPKQLRCRVECCNKVKYEGETKNNLQVRMQMVEGNPMVSAEAVQTTPKQMAKPVWKQKCQLPVPDELNCGRTLSVRKGWVHERRHAPPASPWTADNRLPVMAPSPRSPSKMLSPRHQRISDEALCLQMQQFLDNWHYIVMKSSLGKTMDRRKAEQDKGDYIWFVDVCFVDRFLPVGPFCPFRSDFWSDPGLQSRAEEMAIKQQREAELTARFRLGQTLTPEEKSELCSLARGEPPGSSMKASSEYWISNQTHGV